MNLFHYPMAKAHLSEKAYNYIVDNDRTAGIFVWDNMANRTSNNVKFNVADVITNSASRFRFGTYELEMAWQLL